jgi:hypothetical protein
VQVERIELCLTDEGNDGVLVSLAGGTDGNGHAIPADILDDLEPGNSNLEGVQTGKAADVIGHCSTKRKVAKWKIVSKLVKEFPTPSGQALIDGSMGRNRYLSTK